MTVSTDRAAAIGSLLAHYDALFGADPALAKLRDAYAIPADSIPDPERRRRIGAFFFWAAWACGTNRPGETITYTSNWPEESLIANSPTGATVVWSVVSFIALLAGVGALVWHLHPPRTTSGLPAAAHQVLTRRPRCHLQVG